METKRSDNKMLQSKKRQFVTLLLICCLSLFFLFFLFLPIGPTSFYDYITTIPTQQQRVIKEDINTPGSSNSDINIIDYQSIVLKWNLPSSIAIPILKEIHTKLYNDNNQFDFDYDKSTDIIGFIHPLKTGGTSLSLMLKTMVNSNSNSNRNRNRNRNRNGNGKGDINDDNNKVFPGSGQSSWFDQNEFDNALEKYPPPASDAENGNELSPKSKESFDYWNQISVLYSHSYLRPNPKMERKQQRKHTSAKINKGYYLLQYIRSKIPQYQTEKGKKRIRLITMVRKPVDLAASRYAETQCRIVANTPGMEHTTKPEDCPIVNLTDVTHRLYESTKQKCLSKTNKMKTKNNLKKCLQILDHNINPYEICKSIDNLLESNVVHNQYYGTIMGPFPKLPPYNNQTITITTTTNALYDDVISHTLHDLGGLIQYNNLTANDEDFVWFGITERLQESMCLFYYQFQFIPTKEKRNLYKSCRPINIWEERHIKYMEENEQFDYSIWRSANAILDLKLEIMNKDIQTRIKKSNHSNNNNSNNGGGSNSGSGIGIGETIEDIKRYIAPGCYNFDN